MFSKKDVLRGGVCYFKRCNKSLAQNVNPEKKKKYSHTIQLPKTLFPHWMGSTKRLELDDLIIKSNGFKDLYSWQRKNLKEPEFLLHDGPPYANGVPHMGHSINKILKDIINRSKIIKGTKVHYKPGWDCHGLPIELKALDGTTGLSPLTIRKKARIFASKAIADQRAVFQNWGLMADWGDCYYTFDPSYVKNQMWQFYKLYNKKLVFREMKPVFWSPSSRTALAEAELEYKADHLSDAVTVGFEIVDGSKIFEKPLSLLIWTTTPWTLPANEAVAFNPKFDYSVIELNQRHYIICTKLIAAFREKIKRDINELKCFKGTELNGLSYIHPLRKEIKPVLPAGYVTDDTGTGLVHTAPSHGPDDYLLALKQNLPIVSYVNEAGQYMAEAGEQLKGVSALDGGNDCVLKMVNDVVFRENIKHSYPYDWRTKKPVMIRASKQWFINTNALKENAIEALKGVKIIPERNAAGLLAQIEKRPYWCISRQRAWGVPIPVLFDQNENVIISEELMSHFCKLIDNKGIDFWWECPASELISPEIAIKYNVDIQQVKKSEDILDIWLDSGLSWSIVLDGKKADLYLEGVDQFTGWFQSSLLTSVALAGQAPYKAILAHGFAVDNEGRKMSKSLGNVVNPQDITHGWPGKKSVVFGLDILRWWVAGHSLQHANIPVSLSTLNDSETAIKKIRNSLKFLLGVINDFPPDVKPSLYFVDRYILLKLNELNNKVEELYEQFEFSKICLLVLNFITNDLSSFYSTITKDRLYCDTGEKRVAAQYVMNEVLFGLLRAIAPIVPVLAEEVFSYHPHNTDKLPYFQGNMRLSIESDENTEITSVLNKALFVRSEVMKEKPANIELSKLSCTINAGKNSWEQLKKLQPEETSDSSELVELLQIAQVTLIKSENLEELNIEIHLSKQNKCERCWRFTSPTPGGICQRCSLVLSNLGHQ